MTNGREIKFRVWDVENSKLLSWDEIWYSVCRIDGRVIGSAEPEIWFPFISMALKAPSFKYVTDQYTGLKDKNGVEIYDGDIISFFEADDASKPLIGLVKWGKYGDGGEYVSNVECWTVEGKGMGNLPLSTIKDGGVRYSRGTETKDELPIIVGNVHQHGDLI